jgi:hypothetical protein
MADSSQYGNSEATRRRLAAAMMQEGMQTSPIRSPWQGVARIVQAMMGGYNMHTLDKEAKERETKEEADWTSLPGLDGAPSEAAGWQTSVAPTDGPKENIGSPAPTSRFTPEEGAEIKALMVNPATRKVGLELYMEKLKPKAPEYEFKTVGKNLVRADKRSGKAESIFNGDPAAAAGASLDDAALIELLGGGAPPPAAASPAPPPAAAPAPSVAAPVPQGPIPGMMKLGGPMARANDTSGVDEEQLAADEALLQMGGVGNADPEMQGVPGTQVADAGVSLDDETKARLRTMILSKNPQVKALGRAQALKAVMNPPSSLDKARDAAAAVNRAKLPKKPEEVADQVKGAVDLLAGMPDKFGKEAFERAIGPWSAEYVDDGQQNNSGAAVVGAVRQVSQMLPRFMGEIKASLQGGAPPTQVRADIKQAQLQLASILKPLVRKPGEGTFSDADLKNLIDQVGNFQTARTAEEYQQRLDALKESLHGTFKLPEFQTTPRARRPNDPARAEDVQTGFEAWRDGPEVTDLANRAVESPAVLSLLKRFEMAPAKTPQEQQARDALLAAVRAKEGASR